MNNKMSYAVGIKQHSKIFGQTIDCYRRAVSYLVLVCDTHHSEWKPLKGKGRKTFVEHLIHNTAKNKAAYDFDERFYKFPLYYLRAAIANALGIVESYRSSLENWESGKSPHKGRPPKLSYSHYAMPTLYNTGSFIRKGEYEAKIKILRKNDWVWLTVKLDKGDADYISRHCGGLKGSAPTLEKRHKKYSLRFAFTRKSALSDKKDVITAVDLGINNAAAMCAMLPDGTVIGRKIVSLPREKDRLGRAIGHIKKAQQNGNKKTPRLWAHAKGVNKSISRKTAAAIVEFAKEHSSDAIVFEHLDTTGRKRGSKKQRLHMWRKTEVQSIVTLHAHLAGMRISRVCAWNTSRLAFDGSGTVRRGGQGGKSHSLCAFPTGKQCHADLNAACNIGARFFIRDILKSLPATAGSGSPAKASALSDRLRLVPSASRRTLSDLISLNAALAS